MATSKSRKRTAAAGVPFDQLCRATGIPAPLGEYKFALMQGRQWRFDWAWPLYRVALEIEGGVYTQGRHTRASGFIDDMQKYNAAALAGWLVFRTMPTTLASVETLNLVSTALSQQRPALRSIHQLRTERDALLGACKLALEAFTTEGGIGIIDIEALESTIIAAEQRRQEETTDESSNRR